MLLCYKTEVNANGDLLTKAKNLTSAVSLGILVGTQVPWFVNCQSKAIGFSYVFRKLQTTLTP